MMNPFRKFFRDKRWHSKRMDKTSQSHRLTVQQSQLVVIDVQERLLPMIQDQQSVSASIRFLMDVIGAKVRATLDAGADSGRLGYL